MSNNPNSIYETKSVSKIELLSFMYGSLIVRLTKDISEPNEINKQVELLGYDLGKRISDDIIDGLPKDLDITSPNFVITIIKNLFKYYIGIQSQDIREEKKQEVTPSDKNTMGGNNIYPIDYYISFNDNPLNLYVELPDKLKDLWYSNIICGIIRGLMEIVNYEVTCQFIKDKLRGDDTNEIHVQIIKKIEERFIDDEE